MDKCKHHVKRSSLSLIVGSLEDFWSLDHEVDEWNRGLTDQVLNEWGILHVGIDDESVVTPHPLTNLLLVVNKLSDDCETLFCLGVPFLCKSYFDGTL